MSGEHTHPDLDGQVASVHADLIAAAAELARVNASLSRLTAQVVTIEATEIYAYDFLGKASGSQTFGRSYGKLDMSFYDPDNPGLEFTLRYLNIKPTFATGKTTGAIRPRLVRADGDDTAYDDIQIHKDALDNDGITLRTFVYFEAGDGGDTHWELKCIGGLASAQVGTRYTKKAVILR
jgi:hypothetical protein